MSPRPINSPTGHQTITVTVHGELDLSTAADLRNSLAAAVETAADLLLVDLDDVAFIDSTGLGVLVGAWKAQRAAGHELELVCSRPVPLKLLRLTGLDRIVTVHRNTPALTV